MINNINEKENIIINDKEKQLFHTTNTFIDYFVEIGISPKSILNEYLFNFNNLEELNKNLTPIIICKFPKFNRKSINFDNNLIKFIFPFGFKAIESENKPDKKNFNLILDNKFFSSIYYNKYISCLMIYESLKQYKILYNKYNNINEEDIDIKYSKIYIPKCICFISVNPYFDKYLNILNILNSFVQNEKNNEILFDKLIESLIICTPIIPNGKYKIFVNVPTEISNNPSEISIDISQNKKTELPFINYDLKETFNLLNANICVEIFRYLLLETKIIFFSKNIDHLSNIIYSFVFLLFPLEYQYQIYSILYPEIYHYIISDFPYIFGINEEFNENFFEKNNIFLKNDIEILIIDIDKNSIYLFPINKNDYTIIHYIFDLPKKKQLENEIKKAKKENEKYQNIFFDFMIHLLENYQKFLNKDYKKEKKFNINSMINIDKYLNSLKDDNDFYKSFFQTQMFKEFIYKRMVPKNSNEKIDIIFFEEKMQEISKTNKHSIFSKKISNPLIDSKEYDFKQNIEIKLLEYTKLTNSDKNYLEQNSKYLLLYGIECKKTIDNKFLFNYILFPSLTTELFFYNNLNEYKLCDNHYLNEIREINLNIIKRSNVIFDGYKKISEMENDIYLTWISLWGMTLWYTNEEERFYRFNQFLNVLKLIENPDMKILEKIFESLIKENLDYMILFLYKKLIFFKLIPSWNIFNMVNKILKNNNNLELKDKIIRMQTKKKELKKLLNYNYKIESFKERTLKNKTDENILSEDVIFYAYDKCIDCQKLINLYDVSKDFENMQKEEKWIKCPSCGKNTLLHLNFQFGVELFNNEITELSSSKKLKVVLNSPKFLKDSIYKLYLKNEKFDVENFKELYETYFWNAIWYFKLVNIDINFMLPYLNNISINYNNIINEDKYVTLSTIESLKEYKKENKKLNIENIFKSKNSIFDENELEIENIYFEIIPKIGLITLNTFLQLKNVSITADVFYNNNDIYSFKANSNNNLYFSNFSKSSRKLSGEKIFNNDILQNSINSNLFFDKKYNSYNNENNKLFNNNNNNKINNFNEKDEENIINNNNEEDNLFSSYLNDDNNNDDDPFKINNSQLNKLGTLKDSYIENNLNDSENSSKDENEIN